MSRNIHVPSMPPPPRWKIVGQMALTEKQPSIDFAAVNVFIPSYRAEESAWHEDFGFYEGPQHWDQRKMILRGIERVRDERRMTHVPSEEWMMDNWRGAKDVLWYPRAGREENPGKYFAIAQVLRQVHSGTDAQLFVETTEHLLLAELQFAFRDVPVRWFAVECPGFGTGGILQSSEEYEALTMNPVAQLYDDLRRRRQYPIAANPTAS